MAITGIIPAVVTAFHDDESLNLEATRAHIERVLDAGAHGVFPLGTNGEFFVLEPDEKIKVLEAAVETVAGRVPVYAGTGTISTQSTIRMAKELVAAGADVLSIVAPYFAAASQDEIYTHYRAVADAVDAPILIYNIPARTGVNITPATVERLASVDGIVGVKDSSGNFDQILQYLERTNSDEFAVISGNDSLILWNLLAGGAGGITGIANIYPATLVGIYEAWKDGDLAKARELQDSVRPIRNCFRHGNPNTIVKAATNFVGSPVGPCRAPFNGLSEAALADIKSVVESDLARGLR